MLTATETDDRLAVIVFDRADPEFFLAHFHIADPTLTEAVPPSADRDASLAERAWSGSAGCLSPPLEKAMPDFTFPSRFATHEIPTNGVTIHTRVGGAGPAVVLLHGYGETGDM